jgi:hypothetical protein
MGTRYGEFEFELLLEGGEIVTWTGTDGVDAAHRYAASHQGVAVIAWREPVRRWGVYVWGGARIIEPGDDRR